MCGFTYLNGAQFVFLSRVIVHHHDKIVANMSLLVAAAFVTLPVRHERGYVEDSCRDTTTLTSTEDWNWKTNNYQKHHLFPSLSHGRAHTQTLHDVIMPAVCEFSIISILVKPSKEDLVGVTVFQVD